MVSCAYLRRQAALCLRIAAAVDDQSVAAALLVMADDFSVKADEVDPNLGSPSLNLGSRGEAALQGSKPTAAKSLLSQWVR
jgi:hypothetical protein